MLMKSCLCGCSRLEEIDMTPAGELERQYFVRCSKCGLVLFSTSRPQNYFIIPAILFKLISILKLEDLFSKKPNMRLNKV